jgi:hypothetical protein
MHRLRRIALLLFPLLEACAAKSPSSTSSSPHLTHGVAVGEVDATSAVLWGRCDRPAAFTVKSDPAPAQGEAQRSVEVAAEHDFTGDRAEDLGRRRPIITAPGAARRRPRLSGEFRTRQRQDAAAVRLLWERRRRRRTVCRDADDG